MKKCGFSIQEMKEYLELCLQGESTIIPRKEMLAKKPEKVVELAVKGMLPKGPLGREMFTKLHVYAGPEHPHAAQNPTVLDINKLK